MAWTSPSLRSSSRAICRFDRLRLMKYQAQHPHPQRLVMAGQHRAGQVVETRLAALASQRWRACRASSQPFRTTWPTVAGRAPHTVRPAMLADQVKALGVIEQRGQADQVGAHGTCTSAGGSSPRSTSHHPLHHTRYRNPTAKHGTAQLITPEPAMRTCSRAPGEAGAIQPVEVRSGKGVAPAR